MTDWIGVNNTTRAQASGSWAHPLDNRQDPGIGIIIPVSTSSQVDFLREVIEFIRSSEVKDAVWRCERDFSPDFWMDALRFRPGTTAMVDL